MYWMIGVLVLVICICKLLFVFVVGFERSFMGLGWGVEVVNSE